VTAGALPSPLRSFLARLDELPAGDAPDMDLVGRALRELAADEAFFAPLIARMPPGEPGVHWLVRPERGPRLVLVHRPDGVMAYTHSHRCWLRSPRSAGLRPISAGMRSVTPAAGPN